MSQPWRLPLPPAELADRTVGELIEHAGMTPTDSFALGDVVTLLRRCEYDLDADTLVGLLDRGRVPRPPDGRWDAVHVYVLTAYLEGHRLWMPHSRLHVRKKSQARLEAEGLAATDPNTMPGDQHGLLGLLTILTSLNLRDEREAALELVLHRLRKLGVDLHA